MRLGLLNDVGLVVVFVSLTIIIHSIIPIFIGLGSLNIVIVSPKAITNVADAEAWFRAVPSGENVMKFAHDWGSVLSICEGHQPYTLCTCSIIPARCQPEYIRNCFFTFSSLWRISSCGATEVAQGSIQLEDPQAKNIAAAFDMGCLIVHIFSGGSRVFSYWVILFEKRMLFTSNGGHVSVLSWLFLLFSIHS